jgi:endo-1,4-beta-xylanase
LQGNEQDKTLSANNWCLLFALLLSIFLSLPAFAIRDDLHFFVDSLFDQSDVFYWKSSGHYSLKWHLQREAQFVEKAARLKEIFQESRLKNSQWKVTPPKLASLTRKNEVVQLNTGKTTRIDFSTVHLTDLACEVQIPVVQPIQSSRIGLIGFWARSKSPQTIRISYRLTDAKADSQLWQSFAKLQTEWRYFSGAMEIPASKPGEYSVVISALSPKSTFDVQEDVVLITLDKPEPPSKNAGAGLDPLIELIRKKRLEVHVTNARGEPISNAKVQIQQLRHEFNFGCGVNFQPGDSSKQKEYENLFSALFNCGAVPASWNLIEPSPNKPDFSHIDAIIQWCLAHHLSTMLQDVLSSDTYPKWAPQDPVAVHNLIRQHIITLINRFGEKVQVWNICDNLSEAASNPEQNGFCAWVASNHPERKHVGLSSAYALSQILRWSHSPKVKVQPIFLFSSEDPRELVPILQTAEKIGAVFPNDGYGARYMNELGGYKQLSSITDELRQLVDSQRTTYISDLGIASSAYSKAEVDKAGEAKQVEYALSIYRLLFSRPSVTGIIWANFIDENSSSSSPLGLLRKDGSEKPVYKALFELIHKKWWTQVDGQTDNNGVFVQSAYFGDYQITVTDSHDQTVIKTVSVNKSTKGQTVVNITI